jgi:ketosteroid isomerase-like protein
LEATFTEIKQNTMSTKEIIENYFLRLGEQKGWEVSIANEMLFVGVTTRTLGREAYVQTTLGFLKVVTGVTIHNLVIEGEKAAVEAHYDIVSPTGRVSVCKVAEFMSVKEDKINSSTIFFDTAAFREFMAQG